MHAPSKNNERISVLIPMFNRERFIGDCVESISNQTYTNLHIIVYDDGSTDHSIYIVKKLMQKDKRITLIEGEVNKGVAFARNRLLEACQTKFACWQDSDDLSNKYRIKMQADIAHKTRIVFTGHQRMRAKPRDLRIRPVKDLSGKRAFATMMFPVDKDITFLENKILGGEDFAWKHLMSLQHTFKRVPYILYYVRFHKNRIGALKRKFRKIWRYDKTLSYKELTEL